MKFGYHNRKGTMPKVFYFIAQSGSLMPRKIQSNFYQYTIPEFYRGQVLAEVETATLETAGLQYRANFLKDLDKWDREGMRLIG